MFDTKRLASITGMGLLIALACLANAQSASDQQSSPGDKKATKQAAGDKGSSEEDQAKALAKAVQNPVASLISVPLQSAQ